MPDFPEFMRRAANRIPSASQHTEDIEGFVYRAADQSQIAFWTAHSDRSSSEHVHDFDEWVLVVEGEVRLFADGRETVLRRGDEITIPRGTRQRMSVSAGTRTIHAFAGERVGPARG